MTETALDELVDPLSQKLHELHEQGRSQQREGGRIRAREAGAKAKLTTADRVLATVLYLRKLEARDLIAQPLLADHGCTVRLSAARFRTPADVTAFLTNSNPTEIKSAC